MQPPSYLPKLTVLPSSPGANSCHPSPSTSVNGPLQCCCPRLPAELTQRIPAALASATIASGVAGPPVPSPRLVLNQLTEWLTIAIPCARAYAAARARPTSVSAQIRWSSAPGAISWTISATAVPCSTAIGPSKPPGEQKSTRLAERGRSPSACRLPRPPKPPSITATLTPLPV